MAGTCASRTRRPVASASAASTALMYVGKKGCSNDSGDDNAAAAMLSQVRKDVVLFSHNGYIGDLASGQSSPAPTWPRAFVHADVLANVIAFPPDDYLAHRVRFHEVRSRDTRRTMTRLYTTFKSGVQ